MTTIEPVHYELVDAASCWCCTLSKAECGHRILAGRMRVCKPHHLELLGITLDESLRLKGLDGFSAIGLFCADIYVQVAESDVQRHKKLRDPNTIIEVLEILMEDIREKILEEAWELLPDDQRKALVEEIGKAIARQAGRGTVEAHVKTLFSQHVEDLVAEELDKREKEVVTRVKAELKKRWDELVDTVVNRRLAEAVQKVYAEVVRVK